jgi:flagellar protein FliO/FliZ
MSGKTIVILQSKLDEINGIPSTQIPEEISTSNNFWQLIGLVFLLIVILIATYYTSRFIGGLKLGQLKNSNFNVIDTYRISPNKMLQIVKVGNKYVVIAIGKDTINLITELEETEVYLRETISGDKQNFKQILEKLNSKRNN